MAGPAYRTGRLAADSPARRDTPNKKAVRMGLLFCGGETPPPSCGHLPLKGGEGGFATKFSGFYILRSLIMMLLEIVNEGNFNWFLPTNGERGQDDLVLSGYYTLS
jgi:hypothetical protein